MTEPTTRRTAEDVLRDLAMYLGVGGYNDIGDAPFDPEKFDRKIRWGIDYSVKATVARCADKVEELSKRPRTRWGEVKAAIQAIAPEPEASPAGGDVREAFETCAAICEARADYFDRASGYREWTDAARSYRATAKEIRERAALSPSTSAAEPVAWIANDPDGGPYLTWSRRAAKAYPNPEALCRCVTPPAPAAVDGQRVKALEWLDMTSLQRCAETPFGSYYAYVDGGWSGPFGCGSAAEDGCFDDAKAAAQADYEARIRACLPKRAPAYCWPHWQQAQRDAEWRQAKWEADMIAEYGPYTPKPSPFAHPRQESGHG